MMDDRFSFAMKTTRDGLIALVSRVNEQLEPRGFPDRATYVVNLVLEEILTNIIKYGFDDDEVHDVHVRLVVGSEEILVEFEDSGQEFDPLSFSPPLLHGSILDSEPGRCGLHLVRKMASSMNYRRENEKNVLTIGVRL